MRISDWSSDVCSSDRARHVETLIRARHKDPVIAAIAATTLDIDAVSAALTAQADVAGWAATIGANLTPPATERGIVHSGRTAFNGPSPVAIDRQSVG